MLHKIKKNIESAYKELGNDLFTLYAYTNADCIINHHGKIVESMFRALDIIECSLGVLGSVNYRIDQYKPKRSIPLEELGKIINKYI